MSSQLSPTLSNLPTAFAAACRQARSDSELFERCREVLVSRFGSELIWFAVRIAGGPARRIGAREGFDIRHNRPRMTKYRPSGVISNSAMVHLSLFWPPRITRRGAQRIGIEEFTVEHHHARLA